MPVRPHTTKHQFMEVPKKFQTKPSKRKTSSQQANPHQGRNPQTLATKPSPPVRASQSSSTIIPKIFLRIHQLTICSRRKPIPILSPQLKSNLIIIRRTVHSSNNHINMLLLQVCLSSSQWTMKTLPSESSTEWEKDLNSPEFIIRWLALWSFMIRKARENFPIPKKGKSPLRVWEQIFNLRL